MSDTRTPRLAQGQILRVLALAAILLAPTLLAQWQLLQHGGPSWQALLACAFALWVLALPVAVLGSARRVLLFWLPAAMLVPLQCYLILFFGAVPADAVTASALHVSRLEMAEVLSGFGPLPLLLPLCWLVYWLLWRSLSPWPVLPPAGRKRLAAIMLGLGGLGAAIAAAPLPFQAGRFVASSTFPASTALSVGRVLAAESELQPDTFGAHAPATPLTVILVIGESVRADHLGLLGYVRNTTPQLEATRDHLLIFPDMASTANFTYAAVPNIVRRKIGARTASVASLFHEAGFRTAWFSSQESGLFNPHADLSAFTDPPDAPGTHPDAALLPPFADCLRQCGPRQFIVLHMYGSHFPYDGRYADEDKRYTPTFKDSRAFIVSPRYRQELVNSYDNSILALDRFLAETVRQALALDHPALVLYTSDHGQNLGDDERQLFIHLGPETSRAETMVPLLLWTNRAYRARFPDKMAALRQHQKLPLNHLTVLPTLLDLASVRFSGFDTSESIASPGFVPRPRIVTVAGGPPVLVEQLR